MKKQFLTLALLATVAVGGAFAGSVKSPVSQGSHFSTSACTTPVDLIEDTCDDALVTGLQCTLEDSNPAFTSNSLGTCQKPIFRPNN